MYKNQSTQNIKPLVLKSTDSSSKSIIISKNGAGYSSRALVVHGTNLSFSLGKWKMTRLLGSMYSLQPRHLSILVGILLSDGYFNFPKSAKNVSVGLEQSFNKFQYLFNVFWSLGHYCASLPVLRIRTIKGSLCYSIYFRTRYLPCFTNLYSKFIVNGVKVVPANIIEYLDPVALAHWISGDGEYKHSGGLVLCTNSFTIQEVVCLINALIVRYNLDCTLREKKPGQYLIHIKKNSMDNLRNIVKDHMVPCMLYKIHL